MCFVDDASLVASRVSRRDFLGAGLTTGAVLAAGVPEGKIVQVKGGEHMQFDGYTIEVFPSVHSYFASYAP